MGKPWAAAAAAAGSSRSDMATASWPGIIIPGGRPLYAFFFAMLACSSGTPSFFGLRVTVELFMTVTRSARSGVSSNSSKSPSLMRRPSTTYSRVKGHMACQNTRVQQPWAWQPAKQAQQFWLVLKHCWQCRHAGQQGTKHMRYVLTYLFPCFCLHCILIFVLISPAWTLQINHWFIPRRRTWIVPREVYCIPWYNADSEALRAICTYHDELAGHHIRHVCEDELRRKCELICWRHSGRRHFLQSVNTHLPPATEMPMSVQMT